MPGRKSIRRQLSPDEHIEWIGRPDAKKLFAWDDVFFVPSGIVAFSVGVWWEVHAMRAPNGGWIVGIFGLFTFMAVTAYMAFGRILYRLYLRRRTTYAVTNRRVVSIVRDLGGERVDAASLVTLPLISARTRADGEGNLTFGLTSTPWRSGTIGLQIWRPQPAGLAFYDIQDPAKVAALIDRMRRDEDGPAREKTRDPRA